MEDRRRVFLYEFVTGGGFLEIDGTPVPNGLTKDQACELNIELIKDQRVCCWEIVEVNPTLDTENKMANNAFDILEATTESLIDNF